MGMQLGYTMMTEQAGPKDLVAHVVAAEEAGFDFAVCSDHYFPWLDEMGHSPHAWTVLGAAAQATSRIPLTTYVTCPIFRYHPAVVAQKAATLQILSDGRFTLGLGAGENLNEHVVGGGWPPRRRPPGDARRGAADHPRPVRRRRLHQLPRRALRRRVGEALGPPRQAGADRRRRLGQAVLRDRRRARRRDDRRRAGGRARRVVRRRRRRGQAADRPDADQLRHRQGRRRRPGARAVPLVRPRLEGQRRAARAAGVRRGQPVRPRGGRRRRASRAGTTSTPSSRPRRSTPTPASPTSPSCRSAATSRGRSSSGARRR